VEEQQYNKSGKLVRRLVYPGALKDPKYANRYVAFTFDPSDPKSQPVQDTTTPAVPTRPVEADQDEVEPGIPRFQIYEPGCPMLARYLVKMRWDERNPRKMADHRFDHWVVALAYFAISSGVLMNSSAALTETVRPVWMDWVEEGTRGRHWGRR
jgi:hypothetical protein